jgi:hypothetical protein
LLVDDEGVAVVLPVELEEVWLTPALALTVPVDVDDACTVDDDDADVHAVEPVPLVVPRRKGRKETRGDTGSSTRQPEQHKTGSDSLSSSVLQQWRPVSQAPSTSARLRP